MFKEICFECLKRASNNTEYVEPPDEIKFESHNFEANTKSDIAILSRPMFS